MISADEARARVLGLIEPVGEEIAALTEADGRVLRADIHARRTQPPFDAAAMDGYAVRAADASAGTQLRVVGAVAAGETPSAALGPGEAMRIFTGAPMPDGADGLLLQEDADRDGDRVLVRETVAPGRWIRPRGLDFKENQPLLTAPRRLTPEAVALAAAMGAPWATVARRPRVALLALGDELRLPGDPLTAAQIVSSNNFGVAALVRRAGGEPILAPVTPDDLPALRTAIRAHRGADMIVALGGASDGEHDLSRPAFAAEGMNPDFYKIAMRPGKPLMAGRLGATPVLGLPGNPVSAMVCAHLFLRPAVAALLGLGATPPPRARYPLATGLPANGPREHFLRARLVSGPDGARVQPFEDQDSSRLALLAEADVLAVRPINDPPRAAGSVLDCVPLWSGDGA